MNLLLLQPEDFIGTDMVLVRGRRAEHAVSILKATVGGHIRVGVVNGNTGLGRIEKIDGEGVLMTIKCNQPPPAPLSLTLICAMQRPKTLKKILQCACAMGVKKFFIIECWKVEKSYWSSPLLEPDELREQFILGLEQARDTVMPELELRRRFKPFVEDELPELIKDKAAFVAHPGSKTVIPYTADDRERVLALGPEGGFTDYEVDKLTTAGFSSISLGERPLRTEFALAALIGKMF
jgi:RsmE family RNA methyltransferase